MNDMRMSELKMPNPPPPPPRPVQKLKVWFNPDKNFFEAFMPDGTPLPALAEISLSDSCEGRIVKAVINAPVDVVNERPKEKHAPESFIVRGEDLKRMI